MKVDLKHFVHAGNGLSLHLIPETEIEASVLKAFAAHGHKLEIVNGGFAMYVFGPEPKTEDKK